MYYVTKKSQNLINEKVPLFFLMHFTLLFGSWNDHQTILKILEIEEQVSSWGFQTQLVKISLILGFSVTRFDYTGA